MGIDLQQYRAYIGLFYQCVKIAGKKSSHLQNWPTKIQSLIILVSELLLACLIVFTIGIFYLPNNEVNEGGIHTLVSSDISSDISSLNVDHVCGLYKTVPLFIGWSPTAVI